MSLQIRKDVAANKKVAASKRQLLQIKKSCMTRQETWKLVPSVPDVHQGYQNDAILEFLSIYFES